MLVRGSCGERTSLTAIENGLELTGQVALVTGASRLHGICAAICRVLAARGATDVARLAAWLASPDASWVTGQVIHSEGGFSRG